MRCKKARILLSVSLDGELSRGEELALERHLSGCAECAQEQADLAALRSTMPLWADEEPSEWLAQNFAHKLRQLQEESTARPSGRRRLQWSVLGPTAAGLAAALLVIGLLVRSQIQPPVPQRAPAPPTMAKSQEPQTTAPQPADEVAEPSPSLARTEPKSAAPLERQPTPGPTAARPVKPAGGEKRGERPVRSTTPSSAWHAARPSEPVYDREDSAPPAPEAEAVIVVERGMAGGVAPTAIANMITENLGEAGLAMNETAERVRGNLQRTVDLLVSEPPAPVDHDTYSNGGNTP